MCSRPIECTTANFATLHPTSSQLVGHQHETAPCLVGDTRVLHHCFSPDTFGLLQPKLISAKELLPLTKTVGSHHYQWLCVLTSPPWPRNSPSHQIHESLRTAEESHGCPRCGDNIRRHVHSRRCTWPVCTRTMTPPPSLMLAVPHANCLEDKRVRSKPTVFSLPTCL